MTTEVAIREEAAPVGLSLMEGPDPASAVVYARRVSTVIATVLEEGSGYNTIQGKKHVTIEGWQTLAAMTGHTVEVEWSRIVPDMQNDKGTDVWEARAIVRDQAGRQVAAAESMADARETTPKGPVPWGRSGNYSVRSMAQTRAMSRALASRMRYIVTLAGFSGTPAEEMPGGGGALPTGPTWQERQAEAELRAAAVGVTDFVDFFAPLGVDHPRKLATASVWQKVDDELAKREAEAAAEVISGEIVEEPTDGQTVLAEQKAKAKARTSAPGDA